MLFEHFTRVLLCDTYPTDSFVCSSVTSRRALENILLSLSETLSPRYGIERAFRGRYDVIPLPIDTNVFEPGNKARSKRDLNLPQDCVFILYFGLISNLKADLFPCILALSDCQHLLAEYNIVLGCGCRSRARSEAVGLRIGDNDPAYSDPGRQSH
jgi:hypothetical protein